MKGDNPNDAAQAQNRANQASMETKHIDTEEERNAWQKHEQQVQEKREKQRIWRSARMPLLVALIAILFYEAIENLQDVSSTVGTFFSILRPVFIGIAFPNARIG